jgi:hypothetical protein
MPPIELERTVVKSPPELWDELGSAECLARWLGAVRLKTAEPPRRLEWASEVATGVIELEASGWGTKVRALAQPGGDGEVQAHGDDLERRLGDLLDDIGSSSLTSG